MKKALTIAAMILFSATSAYADGFQCQTWEDDLTIKIYNNTNPLEGTRNSAVMILSDPSISHGRKTIAVFRDVNATLSNMGASYDGLVDLRFKEIRRKGELISGTKLGFLKHVLVDVDFSYATPVAHRTLLRGTLKLIKRDGEVIERDLDCERYLKN